MEDSVCSSSFLALPQYQLRFAEPSPIEVWPNLSTASIRIWAKREDLGSPLMCSGNKYRKLEYIIPDILATPNVTTLVTEGGLQSNHAVQVAVVARKLGLECVLLLNEAFGGLDTAKNQEIFRMAGNTPIFKFLDVQIAPNRTKGWQPHEPMMDELRTKGKVPYWIPAGAGMHPMGGLGYANCAFEIAEQERELGLSGTGRFDYIFVCCGSASTQAGLIAGFRLLDKLRGQPRGIPKRQIIGALVTPYIQYEHKVLSIARAAGKLIGLEPESDLTLDDVRLDNRFHGPNYGIGTDDTFKTIGHVARAQGTLLEPVYTGKLATCLFHWVNSGELENDSLKQGFSKSGELNVLFMHTGGQTVISSYAGEIP